MESELSENYLYATKICNNKFIELKQVKNCVNKIYENEQQSVKRQQQQQQLNQYSQQQQQNSQHQKSFQRICWQNIENLHIKLPAQLSNKQSNWHLSENNKMFQQHPRRRKFYYRRGLHCSVSCRQGQYQMRLLAKMPAAFFVDFKTDATNIPLNLVQTPSIMLKSMTTTMWHRK